MNPKLIGRRLYPMNQSAAAMVARILLNTKGVK